MENVISHPFIERDGAKQDRFLRIRRLCFTLLIICCNSKEDAERIVKALEGRTKRFSLEMNTTKTKVVKFSKREESKGVKQETFDYLGFTFYLAPTGRGQIVPKLETSKKKFRSKLKAVTEWCRANKHKGKLQTIWKIFISKLRGHIRYYGVSFNSFRMKEFVLQATKIFFKWMNRRSQRRSMNWEKFNKFMDKFPLPKVIIHHSLFMK